MLLFQSLRPVKTALIVCLFFHAVQHLNAQASSPGEFRAPLDIPLVLSGNFAEIRSDHFHSGIDIKTQGTTGHRVFAADDGYILRLKVQSGGYGNVIYLAHPNGKTTVYGHLDRFRPDIEAYIRSVQYKRNKHALNIYPGKNQWTVRKGDLIAWSGNTGYSFGPHLHFEVRNSAGQHPENALRYGFPVKDTLAPEILSLWHYSFLPGTYRGIITQRSEIPVAKANDSYVLPGGEPVVISKKAGFGIEAYDYLNGAGNRCGIYVMELFVDGEKQFSIRMDEYSFAESRYINSFIDYEYQKLNNKNIQKLFIEPNNQLSMYEREAGNGLVELAGEDTHRVRIVLKDAYLNETSIAFTALAKARQPAVPEQEGMLLHFDEENILENQGIRLVIPRKTLYTDIRLSHKSDAAGGAYYSDIHRIYPVYAPLHRHCRLSVRTQVMHDSLKEKALIIRLDEEGEASSLGGEWKNGWVSTTTRSLGTFAVSVDTVPPLIQPLNVMPGKDMSGEKSLRFHITDDLSGIGSYDGYIDNKWALFEYDAKNDLVQYRFDPERLEKGISHELELYVVDNKDNLSYYYAEFTW